MRICERIVFALILGAAPIAGVALAFDGAPSASEPAIPVVSAQTGSAAAALKKVVPPTTAETSLTSLQYAAEGGHPVAQWKLGRMYANGDGVTQDDVRAFEYFSRIANAHAEDSPSAPQAARGLMWLTLARDSAAPEEAWIKESYNKAIAKASDNDRAMALQMLEHWVQGRKD